LRRYRTTMAMMTRTGSGILDCLFAGTGSAR
jgi:hypothetical protein